MTDDRHRYQREVERLLEQIRERVRELQLLRVRGARGAAVRAQKEELKRARHELATLVIATRAARRFGSRCRPRGSQTNALRLEPTRVTGSPRATHSVRRQSS